MIVCLILQLYIFFNGNLISILAAFNSNSYIVKIILQIASTDDIMQSLFFEKLLCNFPLRNILIYMLMENIINNFVEENTHQFAFKI